MLAQRPRHAAEVHARSMREQILRGGGAHEVWPSSTPPRAAPSADHPPGHHASRLPGTLPRGSAWSGRSRGTGQKRPRCRPPPGRQRLRVRSWLVGRQPQGLRCHTRPGPVRIALRAIQGHGAAVGCGGRSSDGGSLGGVAATSVACLTHHGHAFLPTLEQPDPHADLSRRPGAFEANRRALTRVDSCKDGMRGWGERMGRGELLRVDATCSPVMSARPLSPTRAGAHLAADHCIASPTHIFTSPC